MKNVLIINGHQPYPFSQGRLNRTLTARAEEHFRNAGFEIAVTESAGEWDVEEEIGKHQWADVVLLQFPVNWMGTPWSLKRYQDEVYSAGMDGRLTLGDGRHGPEDGALYGTAGALKNTRYMLSVTFNAPRDAFDDPDASFFGGRSVDDLLWPVHLNFKFFGLRRLPTFAAHDVMKNPTVESDLKRFNEHLARYFPIPADAPVPGSLTTVGG